MLPPNAKEFDKTARGRECLAHYRREFNDKMGDFKATPKHDWSSHAADAFGGLAYRWYHTRRNPERESARALRAAQRDTDSFTWTRPNARRGGY